MIRVASCLFLLIPYLSLAKSSWPPELTQSDKSLKTFQFVVQGSQFEVHVPQYLHGEVEHIQEILQIYAPKVFEYFQYTPRDTVHMSIETETVQANGSATVFPRNLINLYLAYPAGDEHLVTNYDYPTGLVTHELVHVVHLEQTRNLLKGLETIFGTIARVGNGITPRWFTEGVATWFESTYLPGGRLKSRLLNWEFAHSLFALKGCQDISCLDNPGIYPDRQYAYWAGAKFLQYLEHKSPGTIRCLVVQNSREAPFNLNASFRRCLGDYAGKFLSEFVTNQSAQWTKEMTIGVREFHQFNKISVDQRFIQWQKGAELVGNSLYFVEWNHTQHILTRLNLENKQFSPMGNNLLYSQIEPMASDGGRLIVEVQTSPLIKSQKEFIKVTNSGKALPLKTSGSRHYVLENKRVRIEIAEKNNQWAIFKNGKLLRALEPFEFVSFPYLQGNNLLYLSFRPDRNNPGALPYQLAGIDLTNGQKRVIHSSAEPLTVLGTCHEGMAVSIKGEVVLSSNNDRWPSFTGPSLEKIAKIEGGKNYSALISNRDFRNIYWLKGSCSQALGQLSTRQGWFIPNQTELIPQAPHKVEKVNNYQAYRHLLPRYWFLNYYSSTSDLDWVGITTSINDPLDKHSLGLQLNYYPSVKEVGQSASYVYQLNDFSLGLFSSKSYSQGSATQGEPDLDESNGALVSYDFSGGRWEWVPTLSASKTYSRDLFSTTRGSTYSITQNISFLPLLNVSFFHSANLLLRSSLIQNESFDDYYSYEGLFQSTFRPDYLWKINFRASYAHNDKSSFAGGIISGGGDLTSIHQSYALDYNDLFGNDLYTSSLVVDYLAREAYRGQNMMPLFVKDIFLSGGIERVEGDFIYFDERYERKSYVNSAFAGLKATADLFYYLPVTYEWYYTLSTSKKGHTEKGIRAFIKGDFTF